LADVNDHFLHNDGERPLLTYLIVYLRTGSSLIDLWTWTVSRLNLYSSSVFRQDLTGREGSYLLFHERLSIDETMATIRCHCVRWMESDLPDNGTRSMPERSYELDLCLI
jgi:hypothetical protein